MLPFVVLLKLFDGQTLHHFSFAASRDLRCCYIIKEISHIGCWNCTSRECLSGKVGNSSEWLWTVQFAWVGLTVRSNSGCASSAVAAAVKYVRMERGGGGGGGGVYDFTTRTCHLLRRLSLWLDRATSRRNRRTSAVKLPSVRSVADRRRFDNCDARPLLLIGSCFIGRMMMMTAWLTAVIYFYVWTTTSSLDIHWTSPTFVPFSLFSNTRFVFTFVHVPIWTPDELH